MIRDFNAQLIEKKHLAGEVWGFRFKVVGEPLDFLPGQYVLLRIENNFRQYSIASSNAQRESFELIVEYFPGGLASEYLKALEVGKEAMFKGPAGVFTLRDNPVDKIFLATGTGIAPEKSMIESGLVSQSSQMFHLFFGLKTVSDVYLEEEFTSLAQKHTNFTFTYCISREDVQRKNFIHGHVQDAVNAFMKGKQPSGFDFYVCGGKDSVEGMKEFAAEIGGLPDHIFSEKFTL